MTVKLAEKTQAVLLRKSGKTYSQILKEVKVAKSTLSIWLKDIGLSNAQKQNISLKRLEAQKRGAKAVKLRRLNEVEELNKIGIKEIGKISKRDLFLIGIAIYWAEGAKQKEGVNVSQCVDFSNSDPKMVLIFIKWLNKCCNLAEESLKFALRIHKSINLDVEKEIYWWKSYLGLNEKTLIKLTYKKDNFGTRRHIMNYHGQFSIKVCKSTKLNRRIAGWVSGINCGVV